MIFRLLMTTFTSARRRPVSGVPMVILVSACLLGCGGYDGPPLGTVQGTVTLDGAPLSEAMVTFSPADGRRESFGITDSQGRYEARYNSRMKGAELGEHEVRVSPVGVEPKTPRSRQEGMTGIPPEYSGKNFILKTVESGSNTIDLELSSTPPAGANPNQPKK